MSELILYDRSRVTTDWSCPRKRYLGYEILGQGIAPATTSLELYLGTAVHDGLAAIAHLTKDGVPTSFEEIEEVARQQLMQALSPKTVGELDELQFANEQATLVAGLLRGFHKHVWPKLMATYPEIVCIEQEMHYDHDGLRFMSRPDLVLRDKDGLWIIEYKTTSSKKEGWINSWETAIQLHSQVKAVESTLGEKPVGVIVQGLYKGWESYGKQNSPFCLPASARVLSHDLQWKELGTIKEGDTLIGFDEYSSTYRQWKKAHVEKIGRTSLPCVRVTLDNGQTITCSAEHQWLTAQKTKQGTAAINASTTTWTKACDLRTMDKWGLKASRIVKLLEPWDTDKSFEAGYMSGLLDGEGFLTFYESARDGLKTTLGVAQKPGEILDKAKRYFDDLNVVSYGPYNPFEEKSATSLQIINRQDILKVLGITRPSRLLNKFDADRLGNLRTRYLPPAVVSVEDIGLQEVVTIQTSSRTFIAEGLASHNCYSYFKAGTPPFNHNTYSYDYKPGFKKYPVWQMEGGLKQWVDGMSDVMLAEQFPQTPPIFIKDDLINNFFEQRKFREHEINLAKTMLEAADEISSAGIINTCFPQRFDQCNPEWGSPCQFRRICHGSVADLLQSGYELRVPHHAEEVEKLSAKQELS